MILQYEQLNVVFIVLLLCSDQNINNALSFRYYTFWRPCPSKRILITTLEHSPEMYEIY